MVNMRISSLCCFHTVPNRVHPAPDRWSKEAERIEQKELEQGIFHSVRINKIICDQGTALDYVLANGPNKSGKFTPEYVEELKQAGALTAKQLWIETVEPYMDYWTVKERGSRQESLKNGEIPDPEIINDIICKQGTALDYVLVYGVGMSRKFTPEFISELKHAGAKTAKQLKLEDVEKYTRNPSTKVKGYRKWVADDEERQRRLILVEQSRIELERKQAELDAAILGAQTSLDRFKRDLEESIQRYSAWKRWHAYENKNKKYFTEHRPAVRRKYDELKIPSELIDRLDWGIRSGGDKKYSIYDDIFYIEAEAAKREAESQRSSSQLPPWEPTMREPVGMPMMCGTHAERMEEWTGISKEWFQ